MRIAALSHAPQTHCLSYAEETVWQLNRLRNGSDEEGLFGRISTAFRLTGPLDVAVLQRAAIEVVRRCPLSIQHHRPNAISNQTASNHIRHEMLLLLNAPKCSRCSNCIQPRGIVSLCKWRYRSESHAHMV